MIGGEDGRYRRVQVGDHHRDAVQIVGIAQPSVVGRALLVGPEHGRLQRRVPGLHQVARACGVRREPARDRDHEGVTAGPEAEVKRAGIEQDLIAWFRAAGQPRVGERADRCTGDAHLKLRRPRPLAPYCRHHAAPPLDHCGRLARRTCHNPPSHQPQALSSIGDRTARCGRGVTMSRQKTERLLSLVVCLLSARRYLTAGQIRDAVPGYPETFDAFKRMFERDKDELRELGIPLETGVGADDEIGYRISRHAYELPEIRLEPDEAAVLGLAARVWRRAELAGAAAGALLKLRAARIDAEDGTRDGT